MEGIKDSQPKVRSPQGNGIGERFQRTMLNEFYQPAFRTKVDISIEELQVDTDQWIREVNKTWLHSGNTVMGKLRCRRFWIPDL